jgi:uncharacterized protein involved in exopolysaccharide biosynthesis
MKEREPLISLRDLLTIAFKHKNKIIFSFFPILLVALFIALALPAAYVAKTVIMVKPGWDFMPTLDVAPAGNRMPSINVETMINTEIQILASHDLLEKVVNTVGAFQIYPDLQKSGFSPQQSQMRAVDRILHDLVLRPVKSSNAIEIFYKHRDPRTAATVANTLVAHLKNEHLKIFGETGYPLMEEQLKMSETRLREAVDKLQAFEDRHKTVRFKGLIVKRADLESSLRAETVKLEELRKRIAALKGQKKRTVSDPYTANVGSKLVDLEVKEIQLLATFKENSRPVITVRKEMQKVRDALRQYEEKLNGSQEQASLEADVGPRELKIAGLRQQTAQVDKRLASSGYNPEEFKRLEQDVDAARADHEAKLKKEEEARLLDERERKKATSIQIIETAAVPLSPVREAQGRVVGIGFILAVAVSLALTCLAEYVPQGITGPRGVSKRVRLPVLVSVAYKR